MNSSFGTQLWNITTHRRVYTFTNETDYMAFVKFWNCEVCKYEMVAYI